MRYRGAGVGPDGRRIGAPPPAVVSQGCGASAALHVTVRRARSSRRVHRLTVPSPSYCLRAAGTAARVAPPRCTPPAPRAGPPRTTPSSRRAPAPPRRIFRIGREKSIVQRAPNNFGKTHGALASSARCACETVKRTPFTPRLSPA